MQHENTQTTKFVLCNIVSELILLSCASVLKSTEHYIKVRIFFLENVYACVSVLMRCLCILKCVCSVCVCVHVCCQLDDFILLFCRYSERGRQISLCCQQHSYLITLCFAQLNHIL